MSDNNYASWSTVAGGYVANGKLVSKTPIYDTNGKFKLDVDEASLTGSSTKVANNGATNNGIQTANIQGSNKDVNAVQTQAGSMNTLTQNTSKSKLSPMETSQTQSISAPDPYTAWLNQYNDHVAENNLQGQIDDLIQLQNMGFTSVNGRKTAELLREAQSSKNGISLITGKPFVDSAGELRIKQQMENINNRTISSYERRINNAKLNGDYETAEALQEQLDDFYAVNGISPITGKSAVEETTIPSTPQEQYKIKQDQINEKYDNAYAELNEGYTQMYSAVLNDITNGIMAQVQNLLNFQYDPTKDRALHIAQGYAKGSIKETMNATGMYYSTMTQSAITKAVAELVPVYEKMAKEEIQNNLQTLYNLGNYLMNLETQQFNIWKANVDLKIQMIEQKRKDVAEAWTRANNLGYIDNQASAVLGIEAGTLTYQARKDAQDRQDKIDAELRGYEQQKVMAKLNNELQRERMQEEAKLEMEKLKEQYALMDRNNANEAQREIQRLREQYNLMDRNNANQTQREYETSSKLQEEKYQLAGTTGTTSSNKYSYGKMTASDLEDNYYNLLDRGENTSDEIIDYLLDYGKDDSAKVSFLTAIGEDPKKWLGSTARIPGSQEEEPEKQDDSSIDTYPHLGELARNTIANTRVKDALESYYENDGGASALETLIRGMQAESTQKGYVLDVLDDVLVRNKLNGFNQKLDEYAANYSDDYGKSDKALKSSLALVDEYLGVLKKIGLDDGSRADYAELMYDSLVDRIADAERIDMTPTDFNDQVDDLKWRAGKKVIEKLSSIKDEYLNETKDQIISYVNEKLPEPKKKEDKLNKKQTLKDLGVTIDANNNRQTINGKSTPIFAEG